MDNLRSAFGWSIETGDIARALELASSLMPLWLSRGRIQEGLAWFNAVLTGNASLDELAPHTRARVLADKTVLDAWVNTYNMECAGQALTIARELDDPALSGPSTHRLLQRRCLRRRGGSAILRRGDRPGPNTGGPVEVVPASRSAGPGRLGRR